MTYGCLVALVPEAPVFFARNVTDTEPNRCRINVVMRGIFAPVLITRSILDEPKYWIMGGLDNNAVTMSLPAAPSVLLEGNTLDTVFAITATRELPLQNEVSYTLSVLVERSTSSISLTLVPW